jgi:UDPglucose 6-dehydrogenase
MRIAMIGTGYVGLVSGACFSDFGHVVTCIRQGCGEDRAAPQGDDPDLRARARSPGREQCRSRPPVVYHRNRRHSFSRRGIPRRRDSVPARRWFCRPLLRLRRAREIAAEMRDATVVVIKSMVPVGTNDEVDAIIRKLRPEANFSVVSNPEFLREGAAIEDFKRPDRVGGRHRRRAVTPGDARALSAAVSSTRRRSCSPGAVLPS